MKNILVIALLCAAFSGLAQERVQWDDQTHQPHFADVNGDGITDLILQAKNKNSYPKWISGTIHEGQLFHTEANSKPLNVLISNSSWHKKNAVIIPGNMNDDAFDDLLIILPESEKMAWLEGAADSALTKQHVIKNKKLPWHQSDDVFEFYGGDFNGNGNLDLLSLSTEQGKHLLYQGTGKGNFTLEQKISKKAKWGLKKQERPLIKDFNGDGRDDIFALAKKAGKKHYLVYANEKGLLKNSNTEVFKEKFADLDWFDDYHSSIAQNVNDNAGDELLRMFNYPGGYDEEDNYIPGNEEEELLLLQSCHTVFFSPSSKEKGRICEDGKLQGNLKSSLESSRKSTGKTTQYEPTEPDLFPPATPATKPYSSFGAYPAINQSFNMSWNTITSALYYQIYHSTTDSNYTLLYSGTSLSTSTSYSSTGYRYFRYKACNAGGCSGFSPYYRVLVYNKPGMPSGVSASPSTSNYLDLVTISWTPPSGIIWTGGYYNIHETRPNGSSTIVKTVSNGSSSSTNVIPNSGAGNYTYKVQGCNKTSSYCGAWGTSNTITVRPPIPAAPIAYSTFLVPVGGEVTISFSIAHATSYKIYENGSLIATVSNTTYSKTMNSTGRFVYTVSACTSTGCSARGVSDSTDVNDYPSVSPSSPTHNASYLTTQSITASAAANDGYGSVSGIHYKLDSGAWTSNGSFGTLSAGTHVIYYRAIDSFGYYSPTKSRTIYVNAPTATISNLSYPSVPVGYTQTFSFNYTNATLCQSNTGVTYYQGSMKSGSFSWTSPIRTAASSTNLTVTCSNSGSSDSKSVTTSVTSNKNPIATNDSRAIAEDNGEIAISVLANDSDPDNHSISLTGISQPSHGTSRYSGSTVYYKVNSNYFGSDSFTYTISDGWGGSTTGTVSISVSSVNDAPVARNFSLNMARNDRARSVNVLTPPSGDPDGDAIRISSITSLPANGSASHNGSNSVIYTPNSNWCGNDSISYKLTDEKALSNNGIISINVSCANRSPSGTLTISGTPEVGTNLSLVENISDADGMGTLSIQWKRDDLAISGANASQYAIIPEDIGAMLNVTISYTDGGGTLEQLTSDKVGPIVNPEDIIVINNLSFNSATITVGKSQIITFSFTNATKCFDSDKPTHIFYDGLKATDTHTGDTATRLIPGVYMQKITCENSAATLQAEIEYTTEMLEAPVNLQNQF